MSKLSRPVNASLFVLAVGIGIGACNISAANVAAQAAPGASPVAGIDTRYEDASVRPQDDTYRYLHGKWLEEFQIPADKGRYSNFDALVDRTQDQLHTIVEDLARVSGAAAGGADSRKLADLYASFMDEAPLEARGYAPIQPIFAAIAALKSKREISAWIARCNRTGIDAPYDIGVLPDAKDSSRYAVSIAQSGLGLPDRDYYLKDDGKFQEIRAKYLAHIERMLGMVGEKDAARSAREILALESAMAKLQWTRVDNRDPDKIYNRIAFSKLAELTPGYDWRPYLAGAQIADKVDYVIVRQPSYIGGFADLVARTPLSVWREYFRWHALTAAAPYLSKAFVDERFAFTGTVLRGIPENRPRWKRGLVLLDNAMGEALGRLYVERYFPPQNKQRMQALVQNLLRVYDRDIDTLDWMSADTRRGAHAKLAKLVTKIGYPDKWRDYTALKVMRDDLWGNVERATAFEYQRQIDKLGRPIDRGEWLMTPQTVNAYYEPLTNEIVFPAAILQPPFFNVEADDAVNYGAIGAVIGHEISHGFDDEGSKYDADGNLRDWFAPADHAKFKAQTQMLVAQYDAYEPVPGFHVNGELTLGENIADNAGLSIAYKAYQLSLDGRPAPVIDGLTGEQRFFLGWVQVYRGKSREQEAVQRIKTDPHSPSEVRGKAALRNQAGFYSAFGVGPGDKMYLPPDQRAAIW